MSVICFPTPKCTIYLILVAIFLKLCSVPEGGGEFLWNQMTELIKKLKDFFFWGGGALQDSFG